MHDKANQPVLLENQIDLLLPQIHRILAQDVEESVVLRSDNRNFQDFADEVWFRRTAATTLRIQMADIGDGHIVGTIEKFVPIEIAVKNARAVPCRTEFAAVVVDASDSP